MHHLSIFFDANGNGFWGAYKREQELYGGGSDSLAGGYGARGFMFKGDGYHAYVHGKDLGLVSAPYRKIINIPCMCLI